MNNNQKIIRKTSPSDSIVSFECKLFKRIEKESRVKNLEKVGILYEHLDNWIDPFRILTKKNRNLFRSLVGIRYCESFPDMQLTVFSILSGNYFNAARNLRFTFESMVHAVYLETKYPNIFPNLIIELKDNSIEESDFQAVLEEEIRRKYQLNNTEIRRITGFSNKIINDLNII